MGSHVGPRAGCGCCMPCEVVACIVVLPLPVDILLVCRGLFEVDIYFGGFGAIFAEFTEILSNSMFLPNSRQMLPNLMGSAFPWICIDLSQCMKLHVTVK